MKNVAVNAEDTGGGEDESHAFTCTEGCRWGHDRSLHDAVESQSWHMRQSIIRRPNAVPAAIPTFL
jgi:hypothetical protein